MTEESSVFRGPQGPLGLLHSQDIESLRPALRSGLKELRLSMSDQQIELILRYVGLLNKWGDVYNLTAIKGSDQILVQHVLDCLSIVNPLMDRIGSAAGKVQEVAGKAVGSTTQRAKGLANQVGGAAQSKYGDAKETVKDHIDDSDRAIDRERQVE